MASFPVLEFDPSCLIYAGGISFVVNVLLFRVVSPIVSSLLSTKYKHLPNKQKPEWNHRFISTTNAIVCIILSSYTLYYDSVMAQDKVWEDTFLARVACSIIIGYMLAGMLCMSIWSKIPIEELICGCLHHGATVYAYYYVAVYGILCYFAMLRLTAEMSTPFVNLRWYFDELGTPRSRKIVLLNAALLVTSFFVFRICSMPVFWYEIWIASKRSDIYMLGHIQPIMYIPSFVLDCLNLYWFHKIIKGFTNAIRTLRNPPKCGNKLKQL